MIEDRNGTVVTFYSFNGGTGRTTALANIAWILAANGRRVLVADWNFDSPSVHRHFRPFMAPEALQRASSVTDLIRRYEWAVVRGDGQNDEYTRIPPHTLALQWDFPDGGCLHLLPAGRHDRNYAASLSGLNWDQFYALGGGRFLDALRAEMRGSYDYTLIDSRPGLNDVADICTIQLPDVLVLCFTFSDHGIDGAAEAAAAVRYQDSSREVAILPVPMLVATTEHEKADAGRMVARDRLGGLPNVMPEAERDIYWNSVEVPYRPFYAFEEILAAFGDRAGAAMSLLSAYEIVTRYLTDGAVTALPPMDDALRLRILARFTRQVVVPEEEVALRYAPEDQLWAEWIERVLVLVGVRVHGLDALPEAAGGVEGPKPPDHARLLVILSAASAPREAGVTPRDRRETRGALAVYVDDVPPLPMFAMSDCAFVAGAEADVAIERILRLVGRSPARADIDAAKLGVRFPAEEPEVFRAPARNRRFSGREGELRQLRGYLRAHGGAPSGPVPVVLCGMGGVGKTEIALEYAHRYGNAYDAVWWIAAGPAQTMDAVTFGPTMAKSRWLVIVDNADDVEHVSRVLPHGSAHVVVTSRSTAWQDLVQTIPIPVFSRRESIRCLRGRLPSMRIDEAGRLAALLGDLPAAVTAAGTWLAETGTPVADYMRDAERHGLADVERIFQASLSRLRRSHPTGHRLLQLCSMLAPEIAVDLVYSDALAEVLAPLDPAVVERPYRGLLVQAINRASLFKVDVGRRVIQVHRLLQRLVRSQLTPAELVRARHLVHRVLVALRPTVDVEDPRSWPDFHLLWPHLDDSGAMRCRDEGVRELALDRLRYVALHGRPDDGYDLARRVERAWTGLAESATADQAALDRQIRDARCVLAGCLRGMGRFDESYAMGEADRPPTVIAATGLAADLRALGRYDCALRLDRRTYAACRASLGSDHPDTLMAQDSLATSHRLRGDAGTARGHGEHAFLARHAALGECHPRTLESAANLGRDLRDAGDHEGSIALLRMVRRRLDETLGPEAIRTLNASANLAVSLRQSGRADVAAPLFEDAYERLNDALGPANPDTLACRLSRAINLLDLGRAETAALELTQVQLAYDRCFGPRHPYALVCVNNRAAASRACGDIGYARSLAVEAGRGMRAVLGLDHPHALAAHMNLAVLSAEVGDAGAALRTLQGLAGRASRVFGPDHPDTAQWSANLATALGSRGRYELRTVDPHPF